MSVSEQEIKENKKLLERFPFLNPCPFYNYKTFKINNRKYDGDYDFSSTLKDSFPDGWWNAFGEQMCEEIKEELLKYNYLTQYCVLQIKEKYGALRWYDRGQPTGSKVQDIIMKYEALSMKTCIDCGAPATRITTGWISPYCDHCISEHNKYYNESSVPIQEYFER